MSTMNTNEYLYASNVHKGVYAPPSAVPGVVSQPDAVAHSVAAALNVITQPMARMFDLESKIGHVLKELEMLRRSSEARLDSAKPDNERGGGESEREASESQLVSRLVDALHSQKSRENTEQNSERKRSRSRRSKSTRKLKEKVFIFCGFIRVDYPFFVGAGNSKHRKHSQIVFLKQTTQN